MLLMGASQIFIYLLRCPKILLRGDISYQSRKRHANKSFREKGFYLIVFSMQN